MKEIKNGRFILFKFVQLAEISYQVTLNMTGAVMVLARMPASELQGSGYG